MKRNDSSQMEMKESLDFIFQDINGGQRAYMGLWLMGLLVFHRSSALVVLLTKRSGMKSEKQSVRKAGKTVMDFNS